MTVVFSAKRDLVPTPFASPILFPVFHPFLPRLLLYPTSLNSVTVGLKPLRPRLGQYILLSVLPPTYCSKLLQPCHPRAILVANVALRFGIGSVRDNGDRCWLVPPTALVKLSTRLELTVLGNNVPVSQNARFDVYQLVFGNRKQKRRQDCIEVYCTHKKP